MFKKILQSLSKSHSAKAAASTPMAPAGTKPASQPLGKPASVLDKVMKGAPPTASLTGTQPAAATAAPQTPEALCQIAPKMPKDQIQARLKLLYRRYNHSASSLDPKIRGEAEKMLTAIVLVREKYFGAI